MKTNFISSSANAVLKKIRGLQERSARQASNLFLLEGARALEEAVARRFKLERVVASQTFYKDEAGFVAKLNLAELSVVDDRTFKELHGTVGSCGIIAVAPTPRFVPQDIFKRKAPLVVVLDGVQDPGNLGTIIRSAAAADAAGILLVGGCVDAYNPKVVRSAVGALFDMPLLQDLTAGQCLELLAAQQIKGWICDASGRTLYCEADLGGATALVFGNEASGISAEFRQCGYSSLSIPMRAGSESLNVGVSAGIILCESFRQRHHAFRV